MSIDKFPSVVVPDFLLFSTHFSLTTYPNGDTTVLLTPITLRSWDSCAVLLVVSSDDLDPSVVMLVAKLRYNH